MKCNFEYFQMVYPKIIEIIRLASAPSTIQLSFFYKNVDVTWEIADTIEEAVRYSIILAENDFITQEQLNKIFDNFDGDNWTILSVHNSINWEKVREFAKETLEVFSVEYAVPNLYWIKEIR